MTLKNFLIKKKNQRIFLLFLIFLIVFFVAIFIVFLPIIQSKKNKKNIPGNTIILPSPTKKPDQTNEEIIQSLGYSINCQLVVTTSVKKLFVKKFDRCGAALDYKVSPSKKYAAYVMVDKNKATQLFIYSLDNNTEGQLQIISQTLIQYQFDNKNNLALLLGLNRKTSQQTFVYYFIPLLLAGYPANYYKELDTFTDVDKKRIEVPLPETKSAYAKIIENQDGFSLTDSSGGVLYKIGFNDLKRSLSPTQPPVVNRNLFQWGKRIFLYSNNEFKTIDSDGSNILPHKFICEGIEVAPIGFRDTIMARSPDGQVVAFLIPTEAQMRENPNWKSDILNGKKVFSQGELVLYDFVKSTCQKTGIVQSLQFRESFGFSPNGQYIAFVNKGISIYRLQDHQDYQLVSHNPTAESNGTAVTGPVVWDGSSKFIFTLVSKISSGAISSTKLVRIYFDDRFNGTEQEMFPITNDSLYSVSSDGSKIVYTKDNQLYKYNIDQKINSLFTGTSVDKIKKLVWLRNGIIVSNIWYANENLYFTKLPEMQNFQIDFDGETIVYSANASRSILLYNLTLERQKFFKDKQTIQGDILQMYY